MVKRLTKPPFDIDPFCFKRFGYRERPFITDEVDQDVVANLAPGRKAMLQRFSAEKISTFADRSNARLYVAVEATKQHRTRVHGQRIRLMGQTERGQRRERLRRSDNVTEPQRGRAEGLGKTAHDKEVIEAAHKWQSCRRAEEVVSLIHSEENIAAPAIRGDFA